MITKNYKKYFPELLKITMITKNYRKYSPELLKEIHKVFRQEDMEKLQSITDIVPLSSPAILDFKWKIRADIRNKTGLSRSIYGDKDILLKTDHISLKQED